MTIAEQPKETPNTDTMRAKRGPRSFEGKSVNLTYNPNTAVYDLVFEGRQWPVRFVSPVELELLDDPLAGGIGHTSGKHKFKLHFKDNRLVKIINLTVQESKDPNIETKPSASVNVKLDDPLIRWMRAAVELDVISALRSK